MISRNVILILLVGFLIFFSAQAQEEWSLYMQWRGYMKGEGDVESPNLVWCDEYKYGTELCGLFDLHYDDYIAGSGRYGDGDYLWNSDWLQLDGNDIVLFEPYTGKILDSFHTDIYGHSMGFDGDYLWFGDYGLGIQCVEVGGDPGPYDPIQDGVYCEGLEGYDGHIWGIGIDGWYVVREYDRNGEVLNQFELEDFTTDHYPEEGLAIDPNEYIWVLYRYEDLDDYDLPDYLTKYDQSGNLLETYEIYGANYGPITCAKTRGNLNIQETSLGNIKMMFSEETINENDEDVKLKSSD